MHRIRIRRGMHSHSRNPQLPASPLHPQRNLPTIRDQDFFKHFKAQLERRKDFFL
jgi:hypothetical protein